jgi:hypothetical protein
MRRLAAMRRASVAVTLGLLLTVAACATAAPQGHARVAGMNRCRQSISTRSSPSRTAASTTGGSRST